MKLELENDRNARDASGQHWQRGVDAIDRVTWHLRGCDFIVRLWNRRTADGVCSCPRVGAPDALQERAA